MRKLLLLLLLGGLAYWLVKDRLGGEPDEFVFTEAPPVEVEVPPADAPPPASEAEVPPVSGGGDTAPPAASS